MKIDEIRTIVQLMSDHDLSEFKIEAEEMHLCIKRGHSKEPITVTTHPAIHHPMTAAPPPAPSPAAEEGKGSADGKNEEAEEEGEKITSPIVGTFYRAPAPDADSFVKVGDEVTPETVVCIIEAMKVMNEIKAEKNGVIKKILLENAQPVEYGQPLFVIEPK